MSNFLFLILFEVIPLTDIAYSVLCISISRISIFYEVFRGRM
nr:MAG TPA: hypothetical protein [Caudoviricetes sp.]